jgi:hypothetical protein
MTDTHTPNPALNHLEDWHTRHHQQVTTAGTTVTIEHSPPGRSKASIALSFDADPRLAQLIIWDTGEAELDLIDLNTGTHTPQHHDITTTAEVDHLITEILAWIGFASHSQPST